MPRRKKENSNPIEEKIAQIGEFAIPKEEGEKEEKGGKKDEETPLEEETPSAEKFEELSPEEIKEKILNLISNIASQGLTEEEKENFINNFKFWNGILFEILDIANHLKTFGGRMPLGLTPGRAFLIYRNRARRLPNLFGR